MGASKSKKKIPQSIGGSSKSAGTSAAQKKAEPVRNSRSTGFGATAATASTPKRKKKS